MGIETMRRFLIIVLLAFFVAGGCNSGDGNNPQPTPSPTPTPSPECIPIEGDFEQLSEFVDCPTEVLVQICNNYSCAIPDFEAPDPMQFGIIPLECTAIDCFVAECQLLDDLFGEVVGSGVFTIDEILGNSNFAGTVIIDGGDDVDYECSPIVP
jgi:hypothetical protein